MSSKQLTIPGLEPSVPSKPKKPSIQKQITYLEQRLIYLEAEMALLRAQLEGDEGHE